MSDLTEWLLACIAEDESAAHYALSRDDGGALDYAGQWYGAIKHAERWEPARVLAVCKAHWAIVETYVDAVGADDNETDTEEHWATSRARAELHGVVKMLATIYAGRPGWREGWAL